jgi:sucrose-6-phosphate hydrolase SacC (GH32 family)
MKGSMKNQYIIFFICLFILPLSSCRQTETNGPLKFKGYEGNPVQVPGMPGSWDDLYVITAFVLEDKDTIYLFYTAYSKTGSRALGLATSNDGYHFTKYKGNPILKGDGKGYDAFGVAQAQVLKADTGWVLYFNGREIAGFNSGPSIGRATSKSLTGPWKRSVNAVLTSGRKGEWDADFIYLGTVLALNDSSYIMYYTGGTDINTEKNFFIGMATSEDGIKWKKYNDPATPNHPFTDSDPVMKTGNTGDWDENIVLICDVLQQSGGFRMYYACGAFGYADSQDGIHWKKYHKNPVYTVEDDPYFYKARMIKETGIQGAKFLFLDSLCFMYYDYGHCVNSAIAMAIAQNKLAVDSWTVGRIKN